MKFKFSSSTFIDCISRSGTSEELNIILLDSPIAEVVVLTYLKHDASDYEAAKQAVERCGLPGMMIERLIPERN